jgi:hypothetical protein
MTAGKSFHRNVGIYVYQTLVYMSTKRWYVCLPNFDIYVYQTSVYISTKRWYICLPNFGIYVYQTSVYISTKRWYICLPNFDIYVYQTSVYISTKRWYICLPNFGIYVYQTLVYMSIKLHGVTIYITNIFIIITVCASESLTNLICPWIILLLNKQTDEHSHTCATFLRVISYVSFPSLCHPLWCLSHFAPNNAVTRRSRQMTTAAVILYLGHLQTNAEISIVVCHGTW